MQRPVVKCSQTSRQRTLHAARPPGASAVGRVPRVSRLLALAHKFERLVGAGTIADYATLARLGHVSAARISQIMRLLGLAPDIQEEILFLPAQLRGRDRLALRQLLAIAKVPAWSEQRALWRSPGAAGKRLG